MTLLDISGIGIGLFGSAAFLLVTREEPRAQKAGVVLGQLVPKEPTEPMLKATEREWDGRMSFRSTGAWKAMLGAAPKLISIHEYDFEERGPQPHLSQEKKS